MLMLALALAVAPPALSFPPAPSSTPFTDIVAVDADAGLVLVRTAGQSEGGDFWFSTALVQPDGKVERVSRCSGSFGVGEPSCTPDATATAADARLAARVSPRSKRISSWRWTAGKPPTSTATTPKGTRVRFTAGERPNPAYVD